MRKLIAGMKVSIDGKIEGLAFHNRSVVGTWKGRGESGAFKISRQ